ncbi:MAG TPA: hypothetical protein VN622_10925 [Clostridia bacterium]|nr:hypothetical protein [Clostridia bacterium]
MANERTEAQILAHAPLTLRLGDTDYEVKVLGFTKAEEWRAEAVKAVSSIVSVYKSDCGSNDIFTQGLAFFFLQFPGKMLDLVLSYATDIPSDTVKKEATDEQIALAFGQIMSIAFPFTKELGMISRVMGIASTLTQ